MSVEWISAGVVVAALALFLWRAGAPTQQVAVVAGVALLGIVATALLFGWFESWTD